MRNNKRSRMKFNKHGFPHLGVSVGMWLSEYEVVICLYWRFEMTFFLSSLLFQNMSAICKTEPDETEPTTVLQDPACLRIKEEETGVPVKEEEEEKKISEGDEDILEFVIPGKCQLYVTIECMGRSKARVHAGL